MNGFFLLGLPHRRNDRLARNANPGSFDARLAQDFGACKCKRNRRGPSLCGRARDNDRTRSISASTQDGRSRRSKEDPKESKARTLRLLVCIL